MQKKQCSKKAHIHMHSGRDTIRSSDNNKTSANMKKKRNACVCVRAVRVLMHTHIFTHDIHLRAYHMNFFAVSFFQKPQHKMTKLPECEWFCLLPVNFFLLCMFFSGSFCVIFFVDSNRSFRAGIHAFHVQEFHFARCFWLCELFLSSAVKKAEMQK